MKNIILFLLLLVAIGANAQINFNTLPSISIVTPTTPLPTVNTGGNWRKMTADLMRAFIMPRPVTRVSPSNRYVLGYINGSDSLSYIPGGIMSQLPLTNVTIAANTTQFNIQTLEGLNFTTAAWGSGWVNRVSLSRSGASTLSLLKSGQTMSIALDTAGGARLRWGNIGIQAKQDSMFLTTENLDSISTGEVLTVVSKFSDRAHVEFRPGGSGGSPTGAAGGDLTGTYPNPTLGTGVVISANVLDGTLVNADLASQTIDSNKVKNRSITTVKIADEAVTSAKIGTGEVGASELASTAVTAGSYTSANITVDADGRITAAANGSGGGGSTAYVWTEQFDDDQSLGSNRILGSNNIFTLTNSPDTIISVSINGKRLTGRDFSLSANTIKITKTPSRKDTLQVTYFYTIKQTRTTRYDYSQINNVVFYGNSLFYGVGADIGTNDVVTQTKLLSPSVKFNFVNKGIGGITAPAMQSNISTVLVPSLKSTFGRNIVVVIEGTNQIAGGATGTVAYQSMKALCLAIKATATAPKIIVVTCPPGAPYANEAQRTIYNDSLRLYYRIFADRLVDLSTKRIAATSTANQIASLYLPDLVHLYPEGYTQMAEAIYPKIMSICALDSSSTITTPHTNTTIKRGGNLADSLDRSITLGNIRNGSLKFNTFNSTRMSIDSSGRVIINPVIVNTNAGTNGVFINPSISGNSTGDRVALAVKATVSNSFVVGRKVFRLLGENNDTIMDVSSTVAATNSNYWFEFLKSADLRTSRITLLNDVDLATNAYKNAIFFSGSGEGTANAMTIGRNGNDLRYNVGGGKHSFRTSNTERAYIDVDGVTSASFRILSGASFNPGTFTTGGIILNGPGTANASAIGFASNTFIFNTANNANYDFRIQNTSVFKLAANTGNVAIGNITPTAYLHIKAGTATASTAPLKFTSGTNLTAPEAGAVEYDGTEFYGTTSTASRTIFARVLKGSAALDFPDTASGSSSSLTITVTGAATTDSGVSVQRDNASISGTMYEWVITGANTVTVYFHNFSGSNQNPASGTFRATVTK